MNSRKNVGDVTRQLIQQVTANPARLAANYKETYPAITDAEAQQLATLFIGLWDGDRQGLMKRWRPYKTALQAAARKGRRQPGGGGVNLYSSGTRRPLGNRAKISAIFKRGIDPQKFL